MSSIEEIQAFRRRNFGTNGHEVVFMAGFKACVDEFLADAGHGPLEAVEEPGVEMRAMAAYQAFLDAEDVAKWR